MKINFSILCMLLLFAMNAFTQTLIPYYDNGKYEYSDVNGTVKIKTLYDEIAFFTKDALAIVKKGDNEILINKSGIELASYLVL